MFVIPLCPWNDLDKGIFFFCPHGTDEDLRHKEDKQLVPGSQSD